MTCAVSRIYRGDAADGSAGHRISSLYGTKRSCRHVYCGVGELNGLPAAGGGGRWVRRYLQHREKNSSDLRSSDSHHITPALPSYSMEGARWQPGPDPEWQSTS